MVPLSLIGRAGAVAGTDVPATSPGAKRAGSPSFGKSLEYMIGASQADHQQNAVGHVGQSAPVRVQPLASAAHRDHGGMLSPASASQLSGHRPAAATTLSLDEGAGTSVKPMLLELQPAEAPKAGVQQKSQLITAAAGGTITQSPQSTAAPQTRKSDGYGYGTPSGYYFDSVPSTLDPGSMAFLVGWLGGSVDGQTVRQEQQAYLETYRQRYPDGAPGVKSYITAATNYLTGTS